MPPTMEIVPTPAPVKRTRAPTAYNLFVREAFKRPDIQKLPPKQRMKAAALLWRKKNKRTLETK